MRTEVAAPLLDTGSSPAPLPFAEEEGSAARRVDLHRSEGDEDVHCKEGMESQS